MADFSGKTVLVTGGGSGIGAATCRQFAAAGADVHVIDRDNAAAERVAAEIGGNAKAAAYQLDVSDGPAWAQLADDIAAASGGIDVLVNSAGTITQKTLGTMTAAEWNRVIDVNLGGVFNGIQAVLPHMKAKGGGAIVNIASIAGRRISFGGGANYSASKAGVLGLTRHAAYELAPESTRSVPARPRHPSPGRCRAPRSRRGARRRFRWAAWSSPRTSPMRCCSSPARRLACAPASRSMSMVAC
jgi:NAD(P)-dependent dehydrogenase (short-subunit alcohol dehydrogenase family)